ncbi:transcriptional regulator [Chitinophaga sp. Mgbs1]|uniref:Transcriptional regulator n=1 Tax=Chitinophaga solisilvae TaxID=1233460 RepID=A0A433WJY1_9BACT|nr:transcriptional regulator [Chitinophaga solisilvae]
MKNNFPENEKAVWILKTKGPQPLIAVAEELNITVEGARFQLLKLASEGIVEAVTVSKGRGRPQQIWSLTALGNQRFPDTHADLTVRLINSMRDTLGEEALQTVIDATQKANITRYTQAVAQAGNLEEKINCLAQARDAEGYMASYEKEGDGFLLIENHCPICAAATACLGFCKSELETFKKVIGREAKVKRVNHIMEGARRCAYSIIPDKADKK